MTWTEIVLTSRHQRVLGVTLLRIKALRCFSHRAHAFQRRLILATFCYMSATFPATYQLRVGYVSCYVSAWFKNTRFRVTHGISARTLIGPALERVYASPWLPCWGFSSARTACTPEVPASERAAHPSATPQDSCRLDWALHCAGTGGDSGRTEATSSSPTPSAAAGRSSCAAGC